MHSAVLAAAVLLASVTPSSAPGAPFGDDHEDAIEVEAEAAVEDHTVQITARARQDGDTTVAGTKPEAAPEPDGSWIRLSDIVYVTVPPCVVTSSVFLDGVDRPTASQIERDRENQFIAEYEAHISGGDPPPPPCPRPEGDPGLDDTDAVAFAASASALLPSAAPAISGSYAITGLRSWLDLGRPTTFRADRSLDLGPFTRTGTLTATATTVVDWGDGTVTSHDSAGGSYHEGEPGPHDITHVYRDAAETVTLTVTDTWQITVTVPGLDDIELSWTADPVELTFPVREVRSTRDR